MQARIPSLNVCAVRVPTGEQICLLRACLHCGKAADLWPALHKPVVGQRFGGPLLALAHSVQPITEFAGDLAKAAQLADQFRRGRLAAPAPVRGSGDGPSPRW